MVHFKWECMGTPTIFKHNYPIDYVAIDAKGRRNCKRNTLIILKLKKATERAATEAEVDVGKICFFG